MRGLIFVVAVLAACGGNGPGDDDGGGSGIVTPDAPGGGQGTPLMMNWMMRVGGQSVNCAQMGATELYVTIKPEDSSKPDINQTFQCVLAPGSVNLPAGRYAVEASLYAPNYGVYESPATPVTMPTSQTLTFNFSR